MNASPTRTGRAGKFWLTVLLFLLVAAIGYLDDITGPDLSFSIFYSAPVVLATWYLGPVPGLLLAGMGASVWLHVDLSTGRLYLNPYVPAWNAGVRLAYFVVISRLLYALKQNLAEKTALAMRDQLTGLANARLFSEIMAVELERARRSGRPLTLAYLDLDNFKAVNDTFGHEEGDRVLAAAAAALEKGVRRSDTIARLGGDEFAGLFPETGPEEARLLMEKLRKSMLSDMQAREWPVHVTAGAVTFLSFPEKTAEMVRLADNLMYEGKKQGRNRLLFSVHGPA